MLISGDYDLNLSLRYKEPVKEASKATILEQDYTFTKQVYGLHRLHCAQKIMMKDMSWKVVDGADFTRGGTQPNLIAFENRVFNWLKENRDTFSGFQQRLPNPQIWSTHYFDHIGEDTYNKRYGCCNTLENSIERNHHFHGEWAHNPEEVNLSLSLGRNNLKKGDRTKNWNHIIDLEESNETVSETKTGGQTKTWNHIIDLEESNQTLSNAELKPPSPLKYAAPVSYSGYKHDYHSTQIFNMRQNWFDATPRNYVVADGSNSCLEQNPFTKEVEQCEGPLFFEDISANSKIISSDKRAVLDLNKSPNDDLSLHSDDLNLACSTSSNKTTSRESHRLAGEPHGSTSAAASNDTSAFVHRQILDSAMVTDRNSGYKCMEIGDNPSWSLSNGIGNPCSLTRNSKHKQANLSVRFLDRNDQVLSTPGMEGRKSKEDAMSSHECRQVTVKDTGSDISRRSCKSSCSEDISSGIETVQSGTQLDKSSSFCSNAFQNSETLPANKSPLHEDADSFGDTDDQKGKTKEADGLILRGAASLIYFASECSSMNKIGDENMEQPECSLDSFEEMVLKQPENSVDDYCVTSNAYEVDVTERNDYGITLKRGRRMKDFQRDILPSLATLSRHEISEDIKIMETVLRSREYKKLRSKMSDGHKWLTPVRNKRSRLKYVGRRHYS